MADMLLVLSQHQSPHSLDNPHIVAFLSFVEYLDRTLIRLFLFRYILGNSVHYSSHPPCVQNLSENLSYCTNYHEFL